MKLLRIFIVFIFSSSLFAQYGNNGPVKAFPGAVGGGANSTGGRGKVLCIVNTLNWSTGLTYHAASGGNDEYYTGGLSAALTTPAVGYIVFNLSGNIQLPTGGTGTAFRPVNGKTIFGQSAPLGGITIWGGTFRIDGRYGDGNNLIYRYIRSRPILDVDGNQSNTGGIADDDAYTFGFRFYGGDNVILDHCSISYTYDKLFGGVIDNLHVQDGGSMYSHTYSNNLSADGHTNVLFGVNPNRAGDPENLFDTFTFVGNVLIGSNRTPNVAFNGYAEVSNNVVYDANTKMMNTYYDLKLNHRNNWVYTPTFSDIGKTNAHQEVGLTEGNLYPTIFTDGNYYEGWTNALRTGANDVNVDNKKMWTDFGDRSVYLGASFFHISAHASSNIPNAPIIMTAAQTYQKLIVDGDVGANRYLDNNGQVQIYQDPADINFLNIVRNRTNKVYRQVSEWVLPNIPQNTRPASYDTDNDGMADAWEIEQFGDLTQTYRGDFDGDGYENIEEYMNQVDAVSTTPSNPSPTGLKRNFFNKLKGFF